MACAWSPLAPFRSHGWDGRSSGKTEFGSVCSGSVLNLKERRFVGSSYAKRRLRCQCSSAAAWDWNAWNRHFTEIDQAENRSSLLRLQIEDAIEKEDFQEAARLKKALTETESKDTVSDIMSQLKKAVDEERYRDASKICNHTGSGLVGWWVGWSKDPNDPFGRVVQITPALGRFLARSYSPRQLMSGSPGTPLFEIFVVKVTDDRYIKQVVVLQRATKGRNTISIDASTKTNNDESISDSQKSSKESTTLNEYGAESDNGKKVNPIDLTEEALNNVIDFLKDQIPDLKVKVMKVSVPDEMKEDSNYLKQLMEDDGDDTIEAEIAEDAIDLDNIQSESISDGNDTDTAEEVKDVDVKLVIGGVLQSHEEDPVNKAPPTRVPATIDNLKKDSFTLNFSTTANDAVSTPSQVKVAAVADQASSNLMPIDVAKALWGIGKSSVKVSRGLKEIIKLAVAQAPKWNRLPDSTVFQRIVRDTGGLDPFDGLYIGAFGPYGSEVVQLKRKYGHWQTTELEKGSSIEFFEYVEAVKLTGDLNVPAGQVTFRAKIGKGNRLPHRGNYPEEIGVTARYRGQGRIAEHGFKNPQWVDGELLLLSGKGMGHLRGATLGFLYVVPEQSFLVLFDRLKLPE